jgi:hypothetical protein
MVARAAGRTMLPVWPASMKRERHAALKGENADAMGNVAHVQS